MNNPPDASAEAVDIDGIKAVLEDYPVSFALLFGSTARSEREGTSDIDLMIEFDSLRPGDAGYNRTYFSLVYDIESVIQAGIDVVDIHTTSPTFARIAFDDGVRLLGSEARKQELEASKAGDRPTFEHARQRISDAAQRLREEFA